MNMGDQIVVFKLDNNLFGLPVNSVNEIINIQNLSSIPNKPFYVDGITNLRGRVITVVNLRRRFGFKESNEAITEEKIILIQGTNIGFRVDVVEEIVVPEKDEILDPDEFQRDLTESFIWKLFRHNDGVVIVIDPEDIVHRSHLKTEGTNLADKINGEALRI